MTTGKATFADGSILQYGTNVLQAKLRELTQHLLFGHASGQVLEYITDGDTGFTDTRFSGSYPRLDFYSIGEVLYRYSITLSVRNSIHDFALVRSTLLRERAQRKARRCRPPGVAIGSEPHRPGGGGRSQSR